MLVNKKNTSRGAAVLILIFATLFFTLTARFFYIQATGKAEGQTLAAIAQKKHTRQTVIEGKRGSIYDRTGEAIAHDTGAYTVVAILDPSQTKDPKKPLHVANPSKTAKKLAPLLNMEESKLEELMSKKGRVQVELGPGGRDISNTTKRKIEELKLPGITFIQDSKRFYPNGVFASHIIGYAQKNDEGKTIGKMGVEELFNKELTETDGYMKYQSARNGLKLPDPKESIVPPKDGDDVYLTIDKTIQTFLEDAMNRAVKEYNPKKVIGIVANPKTGEILAMSNRPSFNPNVRNINNFVNDAIGYRFEPGSTMKIFTLAAAIEEGVYNGNEYFKSGAYKIADRTIRDHNKSGWGTITFNEGIQRSSNVAIAILANDKLGPDRLLQYYNRFGFNQPTGIDIPGETTSNILYQYPVEKVTTAFGQGSTFTPIQQVQAATAIANKGKMMKPYVIKKVVDSTTGKAKVEKKPEVAGEPISPETADKVLDILETVVTSPNGTGKPYDIEGYQVAGKTGTAQIPNPKGGGYLYGHGNNTFSFLGMAPKDNPSLIVYVAVQQPKLTMQETGSAPVSLIFNSVMKNSLQYLNIQPEEEKPPVVKKTKYGVEMGSYAGKSTESAAASLKEKGFVPVIVGKGDKVEAQSPAAAERVMKGERVFLKTNGEAVIPDLTNWSYRDVLRLSEFLSLEPSALGTGYVVKQNIASGSPIKKGDYLIVELKSPKQLIKNPEEEEKKEKLKEKEAKEAEKRPLDQ
ncbi:penicillin-binding protein [Priestia abyssalis]|uniref:penicillin-binding protein n=1 Tax=Priestia abyssalis TaxID=1221450 RepID=UPI0009956943|nr:penicillin-binding protein [Priestia abyssalis]